MRTIRASEVGSYLYCKRAWWYQLQGIESSNQTEMAGGSAYHQEHGRSMFIASFMRSLAWVLLAVGVVALVIWLVYRIPL